MIEGNINRAAFERFGESRELQSFRWSDLVARLAASRDLKDQLAREAGGFDAFADLRREESEKAPVNRVASIDGKPPVATARPGADDADRKERERGAP